MNQYTLRRLFQLVPVLFIVSVAVFMIIHLIPGDPAQILAGPNATDEQLSALRHRFGLDRPLWAQYVVWLRSVLTGDLGQSFINNYPVVDFIVRHVPATVELAIAAAIVGTVIAFPLGIVAAIRRGGVIDLACTLLSALSFAIPGFWLAILLILAFSVWLGVFPPSGRPSFSEQPFEHLMALALPAFTLGLGVAARLMRYLRSSMLDTLEQDFTRTARSKGLREIMVYVRHVLPNALIPVVTMTGLQLGDLLSGAIIVESIFAWPGVGRLTVQAIGWRDYALLQANVLFIVLAFMVVNLATDLVYGVIDPRIRYG